MTVYIANLRVFNNCTLSPRSLVLATKTWNVNTLKSLWIRKWPCSEMQILAKDKISPKENELGVPPPSMRLSMIFKLERKGKKFKILDVKIRSKSAKTAYLFLSRVIYFWWVKLYKYTQLMCRKYMKNCAKAEKCAKRIRKYEEVRV